MATLTGCIKKAGAALRAEDKAAILARFNALTKAGTATAEAARQAIDEQIAAVRTLLDGSTVEATTYSGTPATSVQEQTAPAMHADPAQSQRVKAERHAAKQQDEAPASKTPTVDAHTELFQAVRAGTATPESFKAMYRRVRDGKATIVAELTTSTKDELLKDISGYVRPGTTKVELVALIYDAMLRRFALGKNYGPNSYVMGTEKAYEKAKQDALDALVEGQTAESLAEYAAAAKAEFDAEVARRAALVESVKDPKTLDDFRRFVRLQESEGKTFSEARMMLTPEQRALMDDLAATETRSRRTSAKDEQRTQVSVAGQTVDGNIIATKHTKKGHDLFVVQLSERVSREDYETLNAGAKRIGGYYSSFRGGGAIPGFQFTTREQAEAFVQLAGGDNAAAKEAAQARRDAYQDDRSQTAAERLTEMADRMEESADESLGRERKANTARRARFAAAAEQGAREAKAMAKTMRNIAQALTSGKAKFLDRVRTKTQVELLQTYVANAKDAELRAKFPSYAEQEKRKGQPPTGETADYAEFPTFTAYRSDLAALGRQLLDVDGTKAIGQRIMKVADDVSDAFTVWAKEPGNLFKLSAFSVRSGEDVRTAIFKDRETAERAIKRSGLSGKAIVFPEKRGVNRIIMSPSEAIAHGIWKGDGDKRITLSAEFGAELVEKMGRANRRGARVAVPWQFERAHERRKQLERMGLETPAEFRAALREFIGLREQAAEADRVKALERAMVGKAKDGLDFFPTPESVADEMIAAADIKPEMAVLEPSAGMGHIADRIRAAGAEPDVVEIASDRRELLQEKGYHLMPYSDFLLMEPRSFFTFGDVMRAPDGTEGVMHGGPGWSGRASLHELNPDGTEGRMLGWFDRDELVGVRHRGQPGADSGGYDRILMNPPFSDGRDIAHVRHAYSLLKPGGRLVALMGESAFTNKNKRAEEFRAWLDEVGGSEEKLAEGSFMDPSLPVNTGANARMVVIDKPEESSARFSRATSPTALRVIAENDELFALPKPVGKTVSEIAFEVDPTIKVRRVLAGAGQTERWRVTLPDDGGYAEISVRPPNPFGPRLYGYEQDAEGHITAPLLERPGDNFTPQDEDETDDVILDASKVTKGGGGDKVYLIAGALAHNTGRIFIGDPNGLSDTALRRRSEQMLSLALKYGTTEFLGPHKDQLMGNATLGVPPLKWVYGDHKGNIERLIALNVAAVENASPESKQIEYDLDTGEFRNTESGRSIGRAFLESRASSRRQEGSRVLEAAEAGGSTIARAIVLRAVLRRASEAGRAGDGERLGLLGELGQAGLIPPKTFYSRAAGARGISMRDAEAVKATVRRALPHAPDIILLESVEQAPEGLREQIAIEGAEDDVEAVYWEGSIYAFPAHMASVERALFVIGRHEVRHHGMRTRYGKALDEVLHAMWRGNQALRVATHEIIKAGRASEKERAKAIEEALADMPIERIAELKGFDRFVAAVRSWLRRTAANLRRRGFEAIANAIEPSEWTDKDVAAFVLKAEQVAGPGGTGGAFSRAADITSTPAFKAWFRGSAVVDEKGAPLVVYHGTEGERTVFEPYWKQLERDATPAERAGGSVARLIAMAKEEPELHFFAEERGTAESYGPDVVEAFLRIERPVYAESREEAIQRMLDEDADGARFLDTTSGGRAGGYAWVVRDSKQIKSIFNRGTFDPNDPDIRFSRASEAIDIWKSSGTNLTAQDLVNSKGGIFDFNRLGETRQDRIRTIVDGARPFWLGALTRDQIADMHGQEMPWLGVYDRLTRAMENERSKRAQDAEAIYERWARLDAKDNRVLAGIMADATLAQIHPDADFQPGIGQQPEEWRKAEHARLATLFARLPDAAKAVYRQVRDFHIATLNDLHDALAARIERQVEAGAARQEALTRIRQQFDKYLGEGPYFPLSRFGDYIVVATREDGERVVAAYETSGEQEAAARRLAQDGFTVKRKVAKAYSRTDDGAAGRFIGDVLTTIDKLDMEDVSLNGAPAELKAQLLDDVNQMFIRSLPDMSYRKHFAHRKGTPGFSSDMMRGFASSAFHSAAHISRLNHGDRMSKALADGAKSIEQSVEGDFNRQSQVLNEMVKRHEAALNPNTHPIASLLNSLGFVMYLGLSPAAGVINLLQVPMVALPWLGARYGFSRASRVFGKAYRDIMGAPFNRASGFNAAESLQLSPAERAAIKTLQDEGVIDLTQAHDLASATGLDTGNVARSKAAFAMSRAMKIVGWTFHVPEVMNRQVTALAAYRMELARGGNEEQAIEAAREAIKRTQFDYSQSNRARYMQGNWMRVVTQFKQYSQNMTYLLGRAFSLALRGETPEVRAIARRQLVATLGVTFAMAGALGLPGIGSVGGLIALAMSAGGDDDEPWDWKVEFRNLMASTFGKEIGEVISHGIPRALMPWDIANRVSLADLWWRDSKRSGDNPRESFANDMANLLGPTAGTLLGWYTAADHMARGSYTKALESVVPKFIRDPLKAAREGAQGVTSYTGEPLMETTGAETIGQLLGFAPARRSEMYEGRNAVMNAKRAIDERRQAVLGRIASARMKGDTAAIAEARAEVLAWNQRNPQARITPQQIRQSLQQRMRNQRNTAAGITLPPRQEYLRERGAFASVE